MAAGRVVPIRVCGLVRREDQVLDHTNSHWPDIAYVMAGVPRVVGESVHQVVDLGVRRVVDGDFLNSVKGRVGNVEDLVRGVAPHPGWVVEFIHVVRRVRRGTYHAAKRRKGARVVFGNGRQRRQGNTGSVQGNTVSDHSAGTHLQWPGHSTPKWCWDWVRWQGAGGA